MLTTYDQIHTHKNQLTNKKQIKQDQLQNYQVDNPQKNNFYLKNSFNIYDDVSHSNISFSKDISSNNNKNPPILINQKQNPTFQQQKNMFQAESKSSNMIISDDRQNQDLQQDRKNIAQLVNEVYQLEKKLQQYQAEIKLRTVQCNNLKLENRSLDELKDHFSQLLKKEQDKNRRNLDKISGYEAQINMLYNKISMTEEKLKNRQRQKSKNIQAYVICENNAINSISSISQQQKHKLFQKQRNLFLSTVNEYQIYIKALQKQNQKQNDIIKSLQINNAKLTVQINSLQHINAQLNFEKKSLNDQIKELQLYTNQLQFKNSQFNDTINNLQESFANSSKLQEELNKTILEEKHKQDIQKLRQKQISSQRQIQALKARNNQLIKQVTNLKIQIGKMEQKHSQSNYKHQRNQSHGLWSPRNSENTFVRNNSYLAYTEDRLSQTVYKNHMEVQKYKQAKQQLQVELYNLRSQSQSLYLTIDNLQTQLRQQTITFQITLKNVESAKQFQIDSLKTQIKNLRNDLNEHIRINKRKNQEINQKQSLLQKWVSQRSLLIVDRK